jgi:hypothetical protein
VPNDATIKTTQCNSNCSALHNACYFANSPTFFFTFNYTVCLSIVSTVYKTFEESYLSTFDSTFDISNNTTFDSTFATTCFISYIATK